MDSCGNSTTCEDTLPLKAGCGLKQVGSRLQVRSANDSICVSQNGVKAAVPTSLDKALLVASLADTDNFATSLVISRTPGGDGYVLVLINGIGVELGDGVATKMCYFRDPVTPFDIRLIKDIQEDDEFYWNALIAGYSLKPASDPQPDTVDFLYNLCENDVVPICP